MGIHKKILICSLFVLTVCLLSGCKKEKDVEFPKDKHGYPKHDNVLINGKEYKLSGTEKEIEMKLPKDETLEISLPQYQPSHFWCMEENVTLNVTEDNNVSFKWVNVNECGKSFSEKQADYLLKIKIVKE